MYYEELLWVVVTAIILAFVLAFGLGANDVSNSFATSVGAKVLTLKQACIIASIAEFSGALLMGGRVTSTIAKSIIDVDAYEGHLDLVMLGMTSVLFATAVWLILATVMKLPVSATHCVVSSIIGFSLVARGVDSILWSSFWRVLISWCASPLMSGSMSAFIFFLLKTFVLSSQNSFDRALAVIPFIYGLTLAINVGPASYDLLDALQRSLDGVTYQDWQRLLIALFLALFAGIVAWSISKFYGIPRMKAWLLAHNDDFIEHGEAHQNNSSSFEKSDDATTPSTPSFKITHEDNSNALLGDSSSSIAEDFEAERSARMTESLFSSLQILTATFASFSHGGNDVSNAIGPLLAVMTIYKSGTLTASDSATTAWILAYGGVGIVIGLAVWGRRVIETLGSNLTKLSPTKGFAIEIGAATTVLIASILGLPISSTHCKVGSVVAVGFIASRFDKKEREGKSVNWGLFGNIIASWVSTVPFGMGISAFIYFIFSKIAFS